MEHIGISNRAVSFLDGQTGETDRVDLESWKRHHKIKDKGQLELEVNP